MKKIGLLILIVLLIFPTVLAINIKVEKKSSDEVMINEISNPATFNLAITNYDTAQNFRFYNLLGFQMNPQGTIFINKGQTKDVELKIYPREDLDHKGYFTMHYYIRADDGSEISEQITVKMIKLKEAFEIGSGEINPESSSMNIYIQNKENFDFTQIEAKFSSAFFKTTENFALGPHEKKEFTVQLEKEDFKKLMAGFYTMNAEIKIDDEKAKVEGIIKFVEKDLVTTTKQDYGIIISTKIITKANEGNILTTSETVIRKNILSRLFTTFNPEPDIVEREDTRIYYTWQRQIKPGESLEIVVKTNWLFPLLLILLIVTIVVLVKQSSKTNLVLKKRVSFIRTKGGEFALKVTLLASAKKYIEKVNIIDKLPGLVKVYERFGVEKPRRIDEKNRRIEWNFEKLEPGESKLLSYIIYSKVGVIGKFELPSARAIFEKDNKLEETKSNRTFFIAEPHGKEVEE